MKTVTALAIVCMTATAFVVPVEATNGQGSTGSQVGTNRQGKVADFGGLNRQFRRGLVLDRSYVRSMATSSQLEIRLGQLAQTNSQNAEVRDFGQQLINDHTVAFQQATQLAAQLQITIPGINQEQQGTLQDLSTLTGPDFDEEFLFINVQAHNLTINQSQLVAFRGRTADVRAFARTNILVLSGHLVRALELWEAQGDTNGTNGTQTTTQTGNQNTGGQVTVQNGGQTTTRNGTVTVNGTTTRNGTVTVNGTTTGNGTITRNGTTARLGTITVNGTTTGG